MNDITYRQGLRTKGFQISVPTTGAQQTLSLSGLAKSFEGILFSATTGAAPGVHIDPLQLRITLTINNDVVIDDDVADMYSTSAGGFTGGWPFLLKKRKYELVNSDTN
jgi:2-keto-4-pentenoate hydratase/2-oxohepta-3-ene-1,7-dioic acid hydratase in catechol pathway